MILVERIDLKIKMLVLGYPLLVQGYYKELGLQMRLASNKKFSTFRTVASELQRYDPFKCLGLNFGGGGGWKYVLNSTKLDIWVSD